MEDELIDICDENGKLLGTSIPKSTIHQRGFWHHTVHLWIYNSKQEILIQQRSAIKEIFPNRWDISVAGHISSQETPIHAILRETKEELGLKITPNKLVELAIIYNSYSIPQKHIIDNEIHHVFAYKYSGELDSLMLQEEEVQSIRFIKLSDFENEITDPNNTINYYPRTNYYNQVIGKLIQIIK